MHKQDDYCHNYIKLELVLCFQHQLYQEKCEPLVQRALTGYNVSFMALGAVSVFLYLFLQCSK